jgi:hypothetical protein
MTGWKEHSRAIDNSDEFKRVIAGILDSNAPTEMSFFGEVVNIVVINLNSESGLIIHPALCYLAISS